MSLENDEKTINDNKVIWWHKSVALFYRFSAWIIVPILLSLIVGKWLDNKYGTEPWLFLVFTGFAFLVSMYGLVKTVTEEINRIKSKK